MFPARSGDFLTKIFTTFKAMWTRAWRIFNDIAFCFVWYKILKCSLPTIIASCLLIWHSNSFTITLIDKNYLCFREFIIFLLDTYCRARLSALLPSIKIIIELEWISSVFINQSINHKFLFSGKGRGEL